MEFIIEITIFFICANKNKHNNNPNTGKFQNQEKEKKEQDPRKIEQIKMS
jgi:hypothetical protein